MQAQPDIWWGGLFDYSVKPGPEFVKVKASFGQVVGWAGLGQVWPFGDQVGQVQDQVGHGQGQELDNNIINKQSNFIILMRVLSFVLSSGMTQKDFIRIK